MISKRAIIMGVVVFLSHATGAFAQGATDKPAESANKPAESVNSTSTVEAEVRRLLELTGADAIGMQVMDQLFTALRRGASEVPENVWQEVTDEFRQEFARSGGFSELLIPIYSKYFTREELKELITFYESPTGRKLTNALPSIVRESFDAGQEKGRQVIKQLQERFKNRGYAVPIA